MTVALRLARIRDQLSQQLELFGRKADRMALERDITFFEVNLKLVGDEWRSGFHGWGAAQRCADTRHQLIDTKRFHHIIVGASIESLDFIALGIADGEHDDR